MADDDVAPREVVRAFMVTGLRTRSVVEELALESLVRVSAGQTSARTSGLGPEQRAVMNMLTAPMSVAEVSAHLRLPLRVVLVLVGDLMADGLVEKAEEVNEITYELLDKIRIALEAL